MDGLPGMVGAFSREVVSPVKGRHGEDGQADNLRETERETLGWSSSSLLHLALELARMR